MEVECAVSVWHLKRRMASAAAAMNKPAELRLQTEQMQWSLNDALEAESPR